MSVNIARHGESPSGRLLRQRWVPFTATATAVVLTVAAIASAGGGSAGAAAPVSQSAGRFLSGSVGGTSLDVVAGIEGESAEYPADPGANKNSLNVELLNSALTLPFGSSGLQLPDPTSGAVQLGAVSQYAVAHKDGSALGASGAVDGNGGIGVAGSNGVPTGGATLDLGSSPLLSPIASAVADLKVTIGAVAARATQAAFDKSVADKSASCTNGGYNRVSADDQTGEYNIAGLSVDLTSALLSTVGSTLTSSLNTLLGDANLTTILEGLNGGPLAGVISVSGVPNVGTLIDNLLTLHLAPATINSQTVYGVTLSLADGSLSINLAALLKFLGLDINNLCPNTSLLPYLVSALTQTLPGAISALIGQLNTTLATAIGGITITVLGLPLSAGLLTGLLSQLGTDISDLLGTTLSSLDTSALNPIVDLLGNSLLNILVNAQVEQSGTLTETALQVNLLPGGATLTLPNFRALNVPSAKSLQSVSKSAKVAAANAPDTKVASPKLNALGMGAYQDAAHPKATVKTNATISAPASSALIQLNLAQAAVGPSTPAAASTTPASPSPSTSVPATDVPTGVPAGLGSHRGNPVLPITLLALGLMFAAGGAVAFRFRGRLNSH